MKLKHLRRGKIRTLKNNQANYKATVYSPLILSTYNLNNFSFTYPIKTLKIKLSYSTKFIYTKPKFLYTSSRVNTK